MSTLKGIICSTAPSLAFIEVWMKQRQKFNDISLEQIDIGVLIFISLGLGSIGG